MKGEVLGSDQCIDVETALRTHTSEAAWQMHVEHLVGSIEPGKLADFTILDRDPREDPDSLKDIQVVATILGDREIYRR